MSNYYFHAGSQSNGDVNWSDKTRRSKDAAEREAVKMAKRRPGSVPVVEYWDRAHGLRPGWDCASGSYEVNP